MVQQAVSLIVCLLLFGTLFPAGAENLVNPALLGPNSAREATRINYESPEAQVGTTAQPPAKKGKGHVLRVIRELLNFRPVAGGNMRTDDAHGPDVRPRWQATGPPKQVRERSPGDHVVVHDDRGDAHGSFPLDGASRQAVHGRAQARRLISARPRERLCTSSGPSTRRCARMCVYHAASGVSRE